MSFTEINNNYLNYLDMYNWTNDLPANTGAKLTFVTMLSEIIKQPICDILEIGTFVGNICYRNVAIFAK